MKKIKLIFIIPLMLFIFSACKKDNYEQPNAGIYGALTDAENGGKLELTQAGSNTTIRLLVNNPARFPTPSNIDITAFGDGTYTNTRMFSENYRVFPFNTSGPWLYAPNDSVKVFLAKDQQTQVNFKVLPFFRVSAPVVSDSTVTFTVTKPAGAPATNNLSTNNNLSIFVNNYPIVNETVSSNVAGRYYQNQFQFTVQNTNPAGANYIALGTPYKPVAGAGLTYSFRWQNTHLAKGTYYFRIGVLGSGSNGKYNYSPVVQATIH